MHMSMNSSGSMIAVLVVGVMGMLVVSRTNATTCPKHRLCVETFI